MRCIPFSILNNVRNETFDPAPVDHGTVKKSRSIEEKYEDFFLSRNYFMSNVKDEERCYLNKM
jgi:hypothetical protein